MENSVAMNGKTIRKESGRVGRSLIFYTLIFYFFVMGSAILESLLCIIKNPNLTDQSPECQQILEKMQSSGTSSIVGVCVGLLFLLLFFRKRITIKTVFQKEKSMHITTFFQVLCVFLGIQLVSTVGWILMEKGFHLFGYSAMNSMEIASSTGETVSMFLYASIIGPIAEELVYRGFVLRSFQKYGKVAAIFVSALVFGFMHGNIPQGVFAFCIGIVLAYVAIEYSIGWSIALHIINNCIFGDILQRLISGFGKQNQNIINTVISAIFAAFAVVILWKKREEIKTFCNENKAQKGTYRYIFTAIGMLVFMLAELWGGISMLEKI